MNPVYKTFLALKETVEYNVDKDDKRESTFFVSSEDGERILVCHGTDKGIWPVASKVAIEKYNPDLIYCCHPLIMKQRNFDKRIQGIHNDQVWCTTYGIESESTIITVVLHRHSVYHL